MFCIILGFIFGRKGEKRDGLPHRRAPVRNDIFGECGGRVVGDAAPYGAVHVGGGTHGCRPTRGKLGGCGESGGAEPRPYA